MSMAKATIEAIYPLSPLQRGILFASIYDPASTAYIVQLSCPLYGNLDVKAFKAAWLRVVERHPILRTLFTWEGRDEPLQIVRSQVVLPWDEMDWRDLSADEQRERLQDYLLADRERQFELSAPPLMRLALIRVGELERRFVWTKHHLLLDGWSSLRMMEEILAFYEAFRRGQDLVLEPPRPYRDYIAWLKQQDRSRAERFWRDLLKGFSSPTPLPMQAGTDAAPGQETSDSEQSIDLPGSLTTALQTLARERGFTLNTLVLGAWALVLSRYSGERDVVIGATVSGRPTELSGVGSMIGLFINTLPVRLHVLPQTPLLSLLRELQAQQVDARQYEYSSLTDVHGWSDVPRGVPLFRTYMVFENYPRQRALSTQREDGNAVEIGDLQASERPNYPLLLVAIPGERLQLRVLYDSHRYDAFTINRILRHLQTVLERIARRAEERVSDLSLLSDAERHQMLAEWNDTESHFSRGSCISEVIEAQAARRPDAVAVRFEDEHLSYIELNLRANKLANYLHQLGVGPEVRVAICADRSIEMVVGLLAILKAGGAYVPLDPAYPSERIAYMLEDSGAAIVLTQERLRGRLPQSFAIEVCLDKEWEIAEQESDAAPESRVLPENLAYLLYTSGSTGRPKGVAICNGSLIHHMQWMLQEFELNETDRVLQKTPFSFDASVWEFWAPLMCGAELRLARPGAHTDGEYLVNTVRENDVTILQLVPAQLRLMLLVGGVPECNSLRQVFCGGEALGSELQEEASRHLLCALCNLYGPTEATIDTIFWRCEPMNGLSPPIGKPIADTKSYLLDEELEPVSAGVCAELYIAGLALGRGYWDKPDLTAARFVPNPFGERGERMYRTGDLARYLADSNLAYIGRTDHQVKVGGFRIELGEIEQMLSRHPAVRQAVVLAREDQRGTKGLAAYVVAREIPPNAEELLGYLRERLPEYMQPAACVIMDTFPLTPNGKIDRRALPRPEIKVKDAGDDAPRNAAEEALCGIWSQVLGIDRVGIDDNFFRLGGDSILCIQIVSRARQAGYNLAPIDMFEHQTVAELAAVVDTTSVVESEKESVKGDIPLVPIQRRFFDQDFPDPHHWNQSVLLTVRMDLDAALLQDAVHSVIRHHDALRFRFIREDSRWRQISLDRDDCSPFVKIDLSNLSGPDQIPALEREAANLQRSLNITEGPLVRVALFDLGSQQAGRLLIIIHHLVVDGVSWRILLEDLQSAYDHLARGLEVQLPAEITSFHEWARWLQEHSQGEELKQEAEYWLSSEWDYAQALLPVDQVWGDNTAASALTASVWLGAEETRALLREVPAAYHTQINDVLLSALARAYALWTGQDSLLIDLEGHGRQELSDEVHISRTVGWFTSVFPVCLRLRSEELGEVIKDIKEQLRGIPRWGFAYGVLRYLVEDAEIANRLDSLPNPEISFNYLGQFDQLFSEASPLAPAQEGPGPTQGSSNPRRYLIDINALIVNGRLRVDWTYSENIHRPETVVNLANLFVGCLQALITHCLSPRAGGYTPSDFPLANLNQETLDRSFLSMRSLEDVYPLSPMQQGVLFHSLYAPGSGIYFIQMSCRIRGELDVEAFKRSWQAVTDRHPILRTSFLWKGLEEPLQVVHERAEVPWRQEDWREFEPSEQGERLRQFLEQDRKLGIELSRVPLMRLALLRTGHDSYLFVWSTHHLLYDAWCRELIIGEVLACYQSYIQQGELRLTRPRPYRDYIAWLKQQDLNRAEKFWREELRGFTAPIHLECDYVTRSQQGARREERTILLDVGETCGVADLAKRFRVSMSTIVEGAWALVLSRYSGETDLVFGTTVSGRSAPLEGIESMVGLFINTVPVRVQVRDEESTESFLKRLQATQARSLEYELSPLMEVQAWSEVKRGAPLFEYLFLFQNYPGHGAIRERSGAMLQITVMGSYETVNYPLMLVAEPWSQLRLRAAYDAERFDASTIAGLLGHVRQVLNRMVGSHDDRIGEIALRTEAERHRTLVESNDTQRDYNATLCVHELFHKQTEITPDRVAVASEEGHLSYKALKDRADLLANYLTTLGVGPETRVGVCVERGLDMLTGLLGVLGAGGAYVPMDPSYPAERLARMLEGAEASVLLTQEHLLSKLTGFAGELICLDGNWESSADALHANLDGRASTQNLAYVIYTSGSTGKPKGVAISHQALVNYVSWAQHVYLRGEGLAFCLYSSLSFDLTVTSIYAPLISGNRVEVQREQNRESLLEEIVRDSDSGVLKLTPSHLLMIKQRDNRSSAIKRLIVGGEAFESSLAADIYRSFGGLVEIYNEYGPTEATVGCMIHQWRPEQEDRAAVLIGRPAANAQIYLLDRCMNPVPDNVGGELYIGGAGLARGYLGQPDLTAERFVPDPFSDESGARLYRTGDWARYGSDGAIDFIGRIDLQVKIRGFRIEPREIDIALLQHPAVLEANVVTQKDEAGGLRLVACIVPNEMSSPTVNQLRRFLEEKLPAYMVPASFVMLDTLPLTPNGKVDLKALQDLQPDRPELEAAYVAPQSKLEREIGAIWKEALHIERVGIHDNFFDLGGHSILLIQIQSKLEELLKQDISMLELFEHPTICTLARYLAQQSSETSPPRLEERTEELIQGRHRKRQRLRQRRQALAGQVEPTYE